MSQHMLLEGKVAVIYGGGGAIGGAVAREFASAGARIFLAGRSLSKLERVARHVVDRGATVDYAEVDAMDEASVEGHAHDVVEKAGRIDIALNAVGVAHLQGTPFPSLSYAEYSRPIEAYSLTNFITAKAVARHMIKRRSGVILTLSTPHMHGGGYMGMGVACAAVEALSWTLSEELAPHGIRVVCLRPDAIPEAVSVSHTGRAFVRLAANAGVSIEEMLGDRGPRRLPTLAEVGAFATMAAAEGGGAMSGAIANLSYGTLAD